MSPSLGEDLGDVLRVVSSDCSIVESEEVYDGRSELIPLFFGMFKLTQL
jgi:hypothetical protein